MARTGRRWLLAFPLALGLGLAVLPLAKGSVDSSLAGTARAALADAGVTGVTVTSDWAGLRLSGPPSSRDAALAAVARMDHRDAVARVAYAVPAALAVPTPTVSPTVTPTATPTPTPVLVDVSADLVVRGSGKGRVVALSGTVAGEDEHTALLAAVRARAPKARVTDDVTVVEGEASPSTASAWTAYLPMVGPAAAALSDKGRLHVDGSGIALSGGTATERAAGELTRLRAQAAGQGVAVQGDVVGPVTATKQRLAKVKGLTGVQFTHGSEILTPASKKSLDQAAGLLRSLPPGVWVEIRGFTDDKGDPQLNQRLSQRRAASVKQYLLSKGVPSNRLSVKGFGEKFPRASNGTDKGRAANRRIEFVVKGA